MQHRGMYIGQSSYGGTIYARSHQRENFVQSEKKNYNNRYK